MALEIKFRATEYTPENNNKSIGFSDLTGNYDALINTTGYGGGINPERNTLGIFILGKAFTIRSTEIIDVELKYDMPVDGIPSVVDSLSMDIIVDGDYSLKYVGVTLWDELEDYLLDQVIFFAERMWIATADIPASLLDPINEPLWTEVLEESTVPTIEQVIDNSSDYAKSIQLYPGGTVVLSTMDSDRRLVDMVTAREQRSSFIEGTLDDDDITRYRVLLYGAKANSFIECDVNAVYMLKGCDDIYKAAKIRNSSL